MKASKLTPNLLVENVEDSMRFYTELLGFTAGQTVPEQPPFVFGIVTSNQVEIFFNQRSEVMKEQSHLFPAVAGGALTLFIEMDNGIEVLLEKLQQHRVKITMPLMDQFYGMREFMMQDPDGWLITFAQKINT